MNKMYKIVGIFIIMIIGISLISSSKVMDKLLVNQNKGIILIQTDTSGNVNLAVETFLRTYPFPDEVQVLKTQSINELFPMILSFPDYSHIIFGHGTENGLSLNRDIVLWSKLQKFINEEQDNFIPVMACFSGNVWKNYGGIPYEIDAEAAGLLGAFLIATDRYETSVINRSIFSEIHLKQIEKKTSTQLSN